MLYVIQYSLFLLHTFKTIIMYRYIIFGHLLKGYNKSTPHNFNFCLDIQRNKHISRLLRYIIVVIKYLHYVVHIFKIKPYYI